MVCFGHSDFEICFAPQRRALFRNSTSQTPKVVRTWCVLVCFGHSDFEICFAPQRRALFRNSTSQTPKVVRTWCVLCILTWKCASRHNGVHFSNIRTSKSGANMWCFVHFDFKMCFAPQRRALFRHRNFQKWSDHGVFCTFWLQNVLRATTACTFSTSQLPKVVRSSSVSSILTWKCASRHNSVHFFMSHLASWLRTRRFSEPTFRPSGATNHWKNPVNRDFPIFSRIYLFFLLTFSLLSASSLLCVSTVHFVGSLASKLPSNMDDLDILYTVNWVYKPTYNCKPSPRRKPRKPLPQDEIQYETSFFLGDVYWKKPFHAWKQNNCFLEGYLLPHVFFGNAPILSVNLLQTTNLPFSKSSSTLNWRYLAPPNRCLMSCSQLASVIWIRAIPSFQLVQCQEWNVTWMAFFFIMMLAPTHHCQRWEYKRVLNFIELPSFCDTFRIFVGGTWNTPENTWNVGVWGWFPESVHHHYPLW